MIADEEQLQRPVVLIPAADVMAAARPGDTTMLEDPATTGRGTATIEVADELRWLLPTRGRHGSMSAPVDGVNSILDVVESLGVPRTEMGRFLVNGSAVPLGYRPRAGDRIAVEAPVRPQVISQQRFLLDVHLGSLARRMRLLGIDTAYQKEADDPELVVQAIAENRVLLTCDRGLLRRRALPSGALVRGRRVEVQLAGVLDRFSVTLAPWTRCLACNGLRRAASVEEVAPLIEPQTSADSPRPSR